MSKVSNVNILIPTASTDGSGYILYYLKQTLKSAGWKVLAASDGTTYTTYPTGTTGTDQITSPSSGTGGMNNTSSWFRITDPGGTREFVMMRGSSATTAIIKYSRLTKFTSGSPNATTLPTTGTNGDGEVLIGSSTDTATTAQAQSSTLFTSVTTPARLHIITDTSATNDVYPWYFYVFQVVTNTTLCVYSHEAVASGSYSSLDQDPSYFFVCANTTDLFTNTYNTSYTTAALRAWFKYGLTSESFNRGLVCSYMSPYWNTSLYYTMVPGNSYSIGVGDNPYDGKDWSLPFLITTGITNSIGYHNIKGFSTNIKFSLKTTQKQNLSVINRGNESAGLYIGNGSLSLFIFPWTSENVDIITSG